MLKNRSSMSIVVAMVIMLGIVAGCASNPSPDAKSADNQAPIGVMDMDKAIKNHPKYNELLRLQQEADNLSREAQAENYSARPAGPDEAAGLASAADQEFKAKMAAKQAEIETGLRASVEELQRKQAADMDAYAQELDKEYQPEIFDRQLKLKTVKLTPEQATALEAEINAIQKERAAKLAAHQQELAGTLNERLAAKQAAAQSELEQYSRDLHAAIGSKLSAQQAEVAGRGPSQPAGGAAGEKVQAAAFKRQEVSVLQDFILNDIRDKGAKIAVEKGLGTVLTGVRANISAVDITDAVIAEFKK
ncbi:MAG TPA: hypothetical protein PKA10_09225 [Selenomonadales bacterium]|nr:hypothetical protein [Selenomonadales bacterium]